jgi:beta-ureidopropionase
MTIVRAAMTETCNAYAGMPASIENIATLAGKLEDIRRANVDHHVHLIESAKSTGAAVVGLGELFPAPYFALHRDELWLGMAESAEDGATITTLRHVASTHSIVIIAPIFELDESGERFNTAVVIDADGAVLGKYRKLHIPRGHNEQATFDERFYYGAPAVRSPDLQPVFTTAVGRIGVSICYDRHFEGVVAGLAGAGAQIVFSPAVTFGAKSRRMWDLEFAVDAARHRVFLAGSNRRGAEAPWNQEFFGGTHFTGPEGRIQNLSGRADLIVADLDLASLDDPDRSGWNLRDDARPDLRRGLRGDGSLQPESEPRV